MAADLHCHTKLSDGSVGIENLLQLAKQLKLSAVAVTDHDTFAGTKRAEILGKHIGIEVIPGTEFSTADGKTGRKAHLLCYFCENPNRLEGLCRQMGDKRKKAASAILQKVMRHYPITPEMVSCRAQGSTTIYKQHIMHTLMDAGYASSLYGDLFQKLFSREGIALSPIDYPDTREVLHAIKEAGGLAVLAHPGLYDSYDLLEELTALGLDGVEVWHPKNRVGDAERLSSFAKAHRLVMTGGSDFHGMYSQSPTPLGSCTTPEEQLTLLKKRKQEFLRKGR